MISCETGWQPRDRFSHIYAERQALDYPLAKAVISKLKKATLVPIDNYKSIFNRKRQSAHLQQRSKKLILAVKRPPFLYAVSKRCQTFGIAPSYYTTPMLNCLYDCDYCYLRGKTDTANIVMFVNTGGFFEATRDAAGRHGTTKTPLQLNLSYDTDLLAFEKWTGLTARWAELVRSTPHLLAELRTKSAAYGDIHSIAPFERFILAWSLSPDGVARRLEHRAPTFEKRLAAVAQAADDGWPIRLCFDPIIPVDNWQDLYSDMFARVFDTIDNRAIRAVAAGLFRMGKTYFRRLKKQRPDCDIFHMDHGGHQRAVETEIHRQLSRYVDKEKIEIWQ